MLTLPLLVVDHFSQVVELSALAGTWKTLLVSVLVKVAEGLSALHAAGRPIGVLTPTRVKVVSARGTFVPVLDDLVAWRPDEEDMSGVWVTGDAAFAAPECLDGQWCPSAEGDMFSFGVLVAHALTGCLPFRDEAAHAWAGRGPSVLARRPRVLNSESVDVPPMEVKLRSLIVGCLHLDPAKRPSARELVDALADSERMETATTPNEREIPSSSEEEVAKAPPSAPAEFLFDMSQLKAAPPQVDAEEPEQGGLPASFTPLDEEDAPPLPVAQAALGFVLVLALLVWWLIPPSTSTPELRPKVAEIAQSGGEEALPEVLPEVDKEAAPRAGDALTSEEVVTPRPLEEALIHAALPALGCVGQASVHRSGPPLVLELPCHMRCIISLDEAGMPERLIRCRGAEVKMSGQAAPLTCTGSTLSGEMRCTARLNLLLGSVEKALSDTLTLKFKR